MGHQGFDCGCFHSRHGHALGTSCTNSVILRYPATFWSMIQQGETVTGTFAPFLDGPLYTVHWLDALAFSLSGLPAARTSAAAMAFVLADMHRDGAALDYPVSGM
jgi:hypothetical protein